MGGGSAPLGSSESLRQWMEKHGVKARLVHPGAPTPTVTAAAKALGVEPRQVIKTLLFLVDGRPVLVISCGTSKVDRRVLASRFGVGRKRVKLADRETVERLTGYPVGGVPPFGHRERLPAYVQAEVLRQPVVYGGGGSDHAMVEVSPQEIVRLTGAEVLEAGGSQDRQASSGHGQG